MSNRGLGLLLCADPCFVFHIIHVLLYWGCLQTPDETKKWRIEYLQHVGRDDRRKPTDLSPHLEDGFSLRQLEILHDYAVEAFKAGIEYANNTRKGAID